MPNRYETLETFDNTPNLHTWKAWDTKLQRYVVLKQIHEPDGGAEGAAKSGAAALCGLQHPHIIGVYNIDEQESLGTFVVMEYLNGDDMYKAVQRGALTEGDFIKVADQVLDGLVAAHKRGVFHKKINPKSLVLSWLADESFVAKLDFEMGATEAAGGTEEDLNKAGFVSPEQFLNHSVDARSDLYSMGCVFYYMLTGQLPYTGQTLDEIRQGHLRHTVLPLEDYRDDVQKKYSDWVHWLMHRQPDERPRDAAKALEVLREMVKGKISQVPDRNPGLHRISTSSIKIGFGSGKTAAVPTSGNLALVELPQGPAPKPGLNTGTVADALREVERKQQAKPKLMALAGAAAVLILGLGGYALFGKKSTAVKNAPATARPTAASPAVAPPKVRNDNPALTIQNGLVIWLRSQNSVLGEDGKTDAKPGKRVGAWVDLAGQLGGISQFQPTTATDSKSGRGPTLTRVNNEFGLVGEHDVIRFDAAHALRDSFLDANGRYADGQLERDMTIIVVGRIDDRGPWRHKRMICAKSGSQPKSWDVAQDYDIQVGFRRTLESARRPNRLSILGRGDQNFRIITGIRDWANNRGTASMLSSSGKRTDAVGNISVQHDHGPLSMICLGGVTEAPETKEYDFMKGDIAELLIYNRVLTTEELTAIHIELSQFYFGK